LWPNRKGRTAMSTGVGFSLLDFQFGHLYEHNHENKTTRVYGFTPETFLLLPGGHTHFGFVLSGHIVLGYANGSKMPLPKGCHFCVKEVATVESYGTGIVSSAEGFAGMNQFGGPLENEGRFRYVDGCSNSLLVHPLRKGDPCFHHLHLDPHVKEMPHTHPSLRTLVVYRGEGEAIVPGLDTVHIKRGDAFVIEPDCVHSFNTGEAGMSLVTYHPDSVVGYTDDNNPMLNNTISGGKSARRD